MCCIITHYVVRPDLFPAFRFAFFENTSCYIVIIYTVMHSNIIFLQ